VCTWTAVQYSCYCLMHFVGSATLIDARTKLLLHHKWLRQFRRLAWWREGRKAPVASMLLLLSTEHTRA
jgi:hypothetical protein